MFETICGVSRGHLEVILEVFREDFDRKAIQKLQSDYRHKITQIRYSGLKRTKKPQENKIGFTGQQVVVKIVDREL